MHLLEPLIGVFAQNGYAAVLIALLLSGVGVPLPEDISLVAGGVIAGLGYANVHVMFAVGMIGVLLGDSSMFLLGHHYGDRVLRLRLFRWLLPPKRYAKVQRKFERYGTRAMFVARFLPGMRSAIFFTAGTTHRVPYFKFIVLDGMAALISVPLWVYLGYVGADNKVLLTTWMHRGRNGVWLVAAVALLTVLVLWWRRRRRRARRAQGEED